MARGFSCSDVAEAGLGFVERHETDIGPINVDCNWSAQADSDHDLMTAIRRHGVEAHGIRILTPRALSIIRAEIRDV